MTPSGPASIYDPPSASSSEEEEEEESDETMTEQKQDLSEDEEEEEEVQEETDDDEEIPQPPEQIHDAKKPIPSPPQESEDEDTESEDFDMQSVPSPSVSNFTIKPCTTSRSVDNSSRPSGKADPPAAEASQPRYPSKRPMESKENGNGTPNKRGKSMNGGEEKSGNTRLWSENDQIAVLKGIIDYQSNTGTDPLSDAAAFHEVMKKSLHMDVSKGQMMDKIRRMKKKYQINAEKGENGRDPVFTKPHDSQLFELSKRIWGANGVTMSVSKKNRGSTNNGSMKKKVMKNIKVDNPQHTSSQEQENMEMEELAAIKEETEEDFWKKYPLLEKSLMRMPVMHKESAKKAMRMAGSSNANELEEKWRKLELEEMELYKKKLDLSYMQTKMILQQAFK